jgi:outer membrane protein TolC
MTFQSSLRLLEAELEWKTKPAEQIAALEAHLERMKNIHDINLARFNAGRASVGDLKQAEYYRLDAEVRLERAKQKAAVP